MADVGSARVQTQNQGEPSGTWSGLFMFFPRVAVAGLHVRLCASVWVCVRLCVRVCARSTHLSSCRSSRPWFWTLCGSSWGRVTSSYSSLMKSTWSSRLKRRPYSFRNLMMSLTRQRHHRQEDAYVPHNVLLFLSLATM